MRWTLPNIITLARICLTPVVALLPFIPEGVAIIPPISDGLMTLITCSSTAAP